MADTYMVYCLQGSSAAPLVLGVHDSAPTQVIQCAPDASQGNQIWSIHSIPPTTYVFLRHEASGLYAKFAPQSLGQIMLAPLDPQNPLFAIQLQPTSNGFVAINNNNATMVFDVQGAQPGDGVPVIAYPWDGGGTTQNQQWLFGPPTT